MTAGGGRATVVGMNDDQDVLERAADLADENGEHKLADRIREFAARLDECVTEGKGYRSTVRPIG